MTKNLDQYPAINEIGRVRQATGHRGSMGFLTVRQLGKLCANGAIPRPVFYLFLLGNWVIIFLNLNTRRVRSAEIKKGHFRILILF